MKCRSEERVGTISLQDSPGASWCLGVFARLIVLTSTSSVFLRFVLYPLRPFCPHLLQVSLALRVLFFCASCSTRTLAFPASIARPLPSEKKDRKKKTNHPRLVWREVQKLWGSQLLEVFRNRAVLLSVVRLRRLSSFVARRSSFVFAPFASGLFKPPMQ